jgi:hypothetical protein
MTSEWNDAELREVARALPVELPSAERLERMRARAVTQGAAIQRQKRLRSAAFAAFALAASGVVAIGLRHPQSVAEPRIAARPVPALSVAAVPVTPPREEPLRPRHHGVVTGERGASYTLATEAPDELVVLEAGKIHVEVSPLGPGERFRVRAGDGEVEVRGTAFDVTVESGHLKRVRVDHGRVEVRRSGELATVLDGGQSWSARVPMPAPRTTASSAPTSIDVPAPAVSDAPPPLTAPEHPAPPVESPKPVPRVVPQNAPSPAVDPSRDEDRRERREERRERQDQRRYR